MLEVKTRGGKRQGAGRPAIEAKKTTMSVRINPNIKKWLGEQQESRGAIIERLIQQEMGK